MLLGRELCSINIHDSTVLVAIENSYVVGSKYSVTLDTISFGGWGT